MHYDVNGKFRPYFNCPIMYLLKSTCFFVLKSTKKQVLVKRSNQKSYVRITHLCNLRRWHVLGEGGLYGLMITDARGVVVLGLSTCAIFEIIILYYKLLYIELLSFILESI